jgi:uncharacterized protein YabN with tetrapyrrole methylase and pyrophosphatase domain
MDILQKIIEQIKDARSFGFDWPDQEAAISAVIDECVEVQEDIRANASSDKIQEEIGDVIHSAIFLCVYSGFDVEETFKKVINKFGCRMGSMKEMTTEHGMRNLQGQSRDFILSLWDKAKILEKNLIA